MTRIIGLDIGTNSIGWAIVEKELNDEFKLIDKGVRIFQEGVKIEKGQEKSKASERTSFRSSRRIKYRRKLRKINLLKILSENGFCPILTDNELSDWRYKKVYPQNAAFLNWQATYESSNKNPYYYRALAVEQKLDMKIEEDRYKIGRAFYHIVQRRGFLSNRLENTPENDNSIVINSISKINKAKGDRTLGQYLYEKYKKGEKTRKLYTHREKHYLDEFSRICQFQNLDEYFVTQVKKAIFYQRPLKSQKGLIGKCVFESSKPRCPVSRPEYEEYRMLCFVNSIKIKSPEDEHLRFLTDIEKKKIIPSFFRRSKDYFDFEDLAKQLAPKKQYKFHKDRNIYPENWLFNYSMKTTVSGCPVSTRLKDLFGENYISLKIPYVREKDGKESTIDIKDVWHVLFSYSSEEKLKEFAQNRLKLTEEQIKSFLNIKLKKDYASLSLKAINKILPFLRSGLVYSHAVFLANMQEVIPPEIWKKEENIHIIKKEIENIISNHSFEKQICEIVNSLIKNNHEDEAIWSQEASDLFRKDLYRKIKIFYGERTYNAFPEEMKKKIESEAYHLLEKYMNKNGGRGNFISIQRIDEKIKTFLIDNFKIEPYFLKKIYHPSAIEVYKPPVRKEDGKLYLGSPMISSIRNPMAMRALHQLRKIMNELIKNDIINSETRVHIEMARELLNANERKAWQNWQKERESIRKKYAQKIQEHLSTNAIPTDTDILKYQLWEEQKHKCIYTGREIALNDFLGANPSFDIEHTIPRSISLDNSQENKTLCENDFNRNTKRNRIPYELSNHSEILVRIEHWKENYEDLEKQIEKINFLVNRNSDNQDLKNNFIRKRHELRFQKDYWQKKYSRFKMTDVPEGFKNSQLVDTGIITKYARLYLKTIFDKVYTVKGSSVADFRKIWGLQEEYEKKVRNNQIHHCVDAITIACITKEAYENLAEAYHTWEKINKMKISDMPKVNPPWRNFVPDIKSLGNEVFISHYTPDVFSKQTKKKLRIRGRIKKNEKGNPIYQQGDTSRGSLHQQTFYGAVEKIIENKKGKQEKVIKYVVRKPLDSLDDNAINNIVANCVKQIVVHARAEEKNINKIIESHKKALLKAGEAEELLINSEIEKLKKKITGLYTLPNKNGDPVPIKKVRVFQNGLTNPLQLKKQRNKSKTRPKPYKEYFYVANDSNYAMAIYETEGPKGKFKRDFKLLNNLEAGEFYKYSVQNELKPQNLNQTNNLIPDKKIAGKFILPLKAVLKIGTMIILWENSPEEIWELTNLEISKRLYRINSLSIQRIKKESGKYNEYATIEMRHHSEAKPSTELKLMDGAFKADEKYMARRKMNQNQFNALIEGIDFKINILGKISKLSTKSIFESQIQSQFV